jgi:integrase
MSAGVIKRGSSWTFVIDLGRDPATGKRRQYRGTHSTKREAIRARAALMAEHAKGHTPPRRDVTFASYSAEWLEARARRVRPTTMVPYRSAVRHAVRAFGARRLADVNRADIERLAATLDAAGRSRRTCSLTLFTVRSIFAQALDDGLIVRNPAANVEASGRPAKPRAAMPADDLDRLREHLVGDRLYGCWLLTLYGLRRSEVLALRWSDVDLRTGEISISKGIVPDAAGRRSPETPTKTERGTRTLPLPPDVLAALRALREQQSAAYGFTHRRDGYLAVDPSGTPYRPETWSDLWTALCQAAGIEPVTLHAARHTSVTTMLANGAPLRTVAAWHGHDPVVAARTYDHVDQAGLAAAGEALFRNAK